MLDASRPLDFQIPRSAGTVVFSDRILLDHVLAVCATKHGGWSLPFGKVEPGETPLAAAVRETQEETGCRVEPLFRFPVHVDFLESHLAHAFLAHLASGSPRSSSEGEARFVPCSWVEAKTSEAETGGVYVAYNRRAIASARRLLRRTR